MLASSRTSLAVCHVSIEARRDRARLAARVRVPAVTVALQAAQKLRAHRTRLKRGSRGGRSGQLRCYAKHHG